MRRRGVALIVVLWILAILTMLMYAFLAQMRVEYALSAGYGDEKKAEQLAWSAVDYACAAAVNNLQTSHTLTDPEWSHDDLRFFEVALGEGAFTLLHPTYADDRRVLWGLAPRSAANARPTGLTRVFIE